MIVELGRVSEETKGLPVAPFDETGEQPKKNTQ